MSNHSATHLMHSALRNILGEHVQQKGSLVNEEKLRFDFSHKQKLSESQITKIEQEVNQAITSAEDTQIINTSIEESQKLGAIAFFGDITSSRSNTDFFTFNSSIFMTVVNGHIAFQDGKVNDDIPLGMQIEFDR